MWMQKSLFTVMLSLWSSLLAILVKISGKVPCASKWHEATWNQLMYFDLLLLTSSQLSDKIKDFFFFFKCELWFSHRHDVQQPGVQPSPQSQRAECPCVEPCQQPVNCINMFLDFLTDSLSAPCVGKSCEGVLSNLPAFSGSTQILCCAVRATKSHSL